MEKRFLSTQIVFVCIAAAAAVASLFPVHRYIPIAGLAYAVDAFVFLSIALLPRIANARWTGSRWLLIAIVAVFFAEALLIYPIADARKLHGLGSDQDDALIQAGTLLRHGEYPYKFPTYMGNPISDGPGWVILHIPMYSLRLYALETPALFALILLILRRRAHSSAFLFAAVLFLTPVVHMLVCDGSDLLALSAAIFLLCFTAYKTGAGSSALWIVLCGFVSTARVNLIVLPLAILFFRTDWRTARAWLTTIGSLVVALTLHIVFYRLSPDHYAPLHLVGKGGRFLADALPVAVLCALLLAVLLLRYKAANGGELALLVGLFLLLAHAPLAYGDLLWNRQHHLIWDGFEYVALCLVCLSAGAALRSAPLQKLDAIVA
jgi:hypothetical protein